MVFVVVVGGKNPTHEGKKDGGVMGVWPGKGTWCNRRADAPQH